MHTLAFFKWLGDQGVMVIPMLALTIPIVAIIVGGVTALVKARIRHVERMAMIRRGMHPDAVQPPVADANAEKD